MSLTRTILATLAVFVVFLLETGIIVLIAWLVGKAVNRVPKNPASLKRNSDAAIDPGSLSVLDYSRRKRQPIALTIAAIAGVIGTIGVAMYWIGPLAGSPFIGLIGFVLAAVGIVTAGIIYGTNDRGYYL